ncbi:uncharacterized protein [Halyomorpha halys]|uniref:uncharacterized protein n=1 Tax=Halyomorpha halys TaxID=286706 RepID=UPI0006D4E882|nr:uncharacterized protein LOC106677545 [Halyomorpha halys]
MARTFKYFNEDLTFPDALWAEFVATAIYILNRTGKSSIKEKLNKCEFVKLPIKDTDIQDCEKPEDQEVSDETRGSEKEEESESEDESVDSYPRITTKFNVASALIPHHYIYVSLLSLASITNLRDRSKLSKPEHLRNYVLFGEEFILRVTTPDSYEEALSGNDKKNWQQAMDNEIKSLKENHTWELTSLPKGSRTISSKWVYRIKSNPDGSVDKYKPRLVVRGLAPEQGLGSTCVIKKIVTILSHFPSRDYRKTQSLVLSKILQGSKTSGNQED